jgi:hypothetical protein
VVRLSGATAFFLGNLYLQLVQKGNAQTYIAWAFAGLIALLLCLL